MRFRFLLMSCMVASAACGGSEKRPAYEPVGTSGASTQTVATPTTVRTEESYGRGRPADSPSVIGSTQAPSVEAANRTNGIPDAVQPTPAAAVPVDTNSKDTRPSAADNTRVNRRDRADALTPMSQGGSAAEREMTASIRRSVVADKTLSFAAKNVKIITIGTKVTLRGAVRNAEERATIEKCARQTPQVTEVDNQLDISQ